MSSGPHDEGSQVSAARTASASLLRRLASVLYEALLLLAVLWLAGLLYSLAEAELEARHARAVYQLYLVFVAGAYFVGQWVRGGQTLPMKTWRLKLMSRHGTRVTWPRAWLRYVIALAGLAAVGAAFWWALLDREGLFLHDRIAGTQIVRVPD